MKLRNIRKSIVLIVSAGWLALGCELVVDFDRTKIPTDTTDATPDVDIDASIDTLAPDVVTTDDGGDAEASTDDGGDADAGDADANDGATP